MTFLFVMPGPFVSSLVGASIAALMFPKQGTTSNAKVHEDSVPAKPNDGKHEKGDGPIAMLIVSAVVAIGAFLVLFVDSVQLPCFIGLLVALLSKWGAAGLLLLLSGLIFLGSMKKFRNQKMD